MHGFRAPDVMARESKAERITCLYADRPVTRERIGGSMKQIRESTQRSLLGKDVCRVEH